MIDETKICGCGKKTYYVRVVDGKQVFACNKYKRCVSSQSNELDDARYEIKRLQTELDQAKQDRDEAYDDAKHVIRQVQKEINFYKSEYKELEIRYEMLMENASKIIESTMSPVTIVWKKDDKND